ncbi:MAG: thioether cross-link-forming SCIFF peptide maturase [Eubacterium sp.]|nr:thioether cross-link-forming SCIFF peptide maturase [Eubacterium sp.]MCM1419163.1 thioether cross-link-forming SCIFF peptide maturase [Roseburia sp.]
MIHRFRQGERYFVLDVASGGVHSVDRMAYDLIGALTPPLGETLPASVAAALGEYPADELNECYAEVYALYRAGTLFSRDDYQKYAELSVKAPIKALCLHVSHDCNLRCRYCFAQTGDFGTGRKTMTPEMGKRAIDFLIEHSAGRENLELDFFGGEPLMAWDTVTAVVEYARSVEQKHGKKFRFTITTNGLLLDDEKIEYINREMSNCVLSLDGRREVNDRIRLTPNEKGCYDALIPKYQKLVRSRTNPGRTDYYVRGTFTKYNLDFAEDVLHIASLGFSQLSVEPVTAPPEEPYAITEEDLPEIYRNYDRLYEIMAERLLSDGKKPFNFFHFMIDLKQGPCAIKRLRGCGCGNEYVAVTPDGEIYPCHQFVGIDEWKLGNLSEGIVKPEIMEYFAKTHIYSKEDCGTCWARFYCSGGCNANGFIYEGDVRKPMKLQCAMMKKRIECGIALGALLEEVKENL